MFGRSIAFLLVIMFAVSLCGQAGAVTTGTGNGTYDFGSLGAADSGGAGFKTQGDKFKVSNAFAPGDDVYGALTSIYAGDANGLALGATSTLTIKAEGGTTNKHFTLKDMNFDVSPGTGGFRDLDTFTITLKDSGGSTIATHSLSSNVSIPEFLTVSKFMSTFPFSVPFPAAGYDYVSEITITWHFTTASNFAPAELNFNSITVANVSAIPLPTVTSNAASGITATGATLNGTANANGNNTTVTFDYGTTTGYGSSATATQSPVTGSSNTAVSASISGLTCGGATYHFRVKGANGGGTSNGGDLTFTTGVCAPTVTGILPTSGPTAGGTVVTITGTNLTGATSVTIGGTAATGISVVGPTSITATTPAGAAGARDVVVVTPGGTGTGTGLFTYIAAPTVTGISPASGPPAGGTSVVITGTNLTAATAVKFGATNATGYTVNSATQVTATSPAGSVGTVDITVVTAGGTSTTGASDQFSYVTAPTVTTQAASAAVATSATGNGTITATGGANATARGVIYWGYNNSDQVIGDGGVTNVSENGSFGAEAFTASLTSLSVNTQYNARAYATSPNGTGYGVRVAFWTLANVPSAPTVNNATATTLDVTVSVNGNPAGTEFCIQETSTGNYVQAGGTLGVGQVWQNAATWGTKTVTGLTTGTTYTFQVKARNGGSTETAYGATASGVPVAAPTVTTQAASGIAATSATGNGTITATNGANATARGVIYYDYTNTDKIIGDAGVTNASEGGNFTTGAFTASLISLAANTQYNARAYATSPNGTGYGARVAFWSLANVPSAPTVSTPTATTLNVAVNVNGNPAATEFCIQETGTGNYVQADGTLAVGAVWQNAATWGTKTVTGLTTGTAYTFQVKARNGGATETAYGSTATGVPVAAPTVTTQAASAITATAATGNGNITATGGANATARGVIYYLYTNTDLAIGGAGVTNISEVGGYSTGAFTESLTPLAANTQYNVRAYAISPNGTGYGARDAFWTLANVPSAPTVNTPTAITLNVAVNVNANPVATEFCIQETGTGNYVQADGLLGVGQVWQTAATWGTKTVTGLTTGTTYTFQVKARNGGSTETAYGATASGVPVAATLTVTTISDSGDGSLRQTITDANPGDAIIFDSSLNGQTITLASTPLTIAKDLTISGPGAATLTISGNGTIQPFLVNAGVNFTLQNLTIANGAAANGGALAATATATTTITGCAFTNNNATGNGGAINAAGIMTISDTLFSGDSAVQGGAIFNNNATLTLTNITLNNNSAANGGGIYNTGGIATIVNATIAGNSATTQGGGIAIAGGTVNLKNNIVASNTSDSGPDIFGTIASQGYNLIKDTTGATINGDTTGNITGQDPLLATLANNGGLTFTMALLSGSQAIDKGNCTSGPVADQRGMTRPQDATCDMGAYERGLPAALTATGGTPQSAVISTAFSTQLKAKVADSFGALLDGISVAFAGPGSGAGITSGSSVTTDASGIASFSATANGTAGTYTVTATVNALTSGFSLSNTMANQAITFNPPATATYGDTPITLSATGGLSGNPVTFAVTSGPGSLTGNVLTITGAGNIIVTASQAGNANYNAVTSIQKTIAVGKATATIALTPASLVATYDGTAKAAAATTSPSGLSVTFTYDGSSTVPIAVGSYSVVASISDANYQGGGTGTLSIGKGSQTITFGTPPTVVVGGSGTVSATASSSLTVAFSSTTPTVCTVSGVTVTAVTAGTCIITADQAGNANYAAAATVSQNLIVDYNSAAPTLTISTLADGSITNNATLNVSGTATSINGIQSVTVNSTAVTLAGNGTFSQAVTLQPGNNTITVIATDNAGTTTTDSRTITLDTTAPVITITTPADNSTLAAASVTVTGTVDKSATVQATVNSGSPQSAAMDGASFSVTLNLAEGSNTIVVSATDLAGNSASVKRTITSDTTKPTLAIIEPAQDITTSEPTLTITGTVTDALTDVSVTIACDGKSYTPQVANGAFQQQITFTTAKQYAITVTATDQAGNSVTTQRNVIYALSSLPSGDINNDGKVDIADALLALRAAVGIVTPDQAQLAAGDVAPLVNGKPAPDGVIDIADAMLILEKAVGILTW